MLDLNIKFPIWVINSDNVWEQDGIIFIDDKVLDEYTNKFVTKVMKLTSDNVEFEAISNLIKEFLTYIFVGIMVSPFCFTSIPRDKSSFLLSNIFLDLLGFSFS